MKIDLIEKYIETNTHHFLIVHYRKWFRKKTVVVFRKKGISGRWIRLDNGYYFYDLDKCFDAFISTDLHFMPTCDIEVLHKNKTDFKLITNLFIF